MRPSRLAEEKMSTAFVIASRLILGYAVLGISVDAIWEQRRLRELRDERDLQMAEWRLKRKQFEEECNELEAERAELLQEFDKVEERRRESDRVLAQSFANLRRGFEELRHERWKFERERARFVKEVRRVRELEEEKRVQVLGATQRARKVEEERRALAAKIELARCPKQRGSVFWWRRAEFGD